MRRKAAVISPFGITEALMMMVASHRLLMQGYEVTTYHSDLCQLHEWFPDHNLAPLPKTDDLPEALIAYDLVIMQYDNTPYTNRIIELYNEDIFQTLSLFYSKYDKAQDPPLTPWDRVFNSSFPMVDNIARAISSLFHLNNVSKNNGLIPLPGLIHRHFDKRVILHATSKQTSKAWTPSRFIKTAKRLLRLGYEPVFAINPKDRNKWLHLTSAGFSLPEFPSLSHLSEYIYESGYVIGNESSISHLASNLQIPTLVITGDRHRMRLYRPGWHAGLICAPSPFIPHKPEHWQRLIFPRHVLSSFQKLTLQGPLRH
ncbi:MAG: glycosyltransferase family 9 protein [Simkaniaceae bacterium]|nr:glycosyltransferase family 9 protein [Simkaniaceae bacterium]